MLARYLTAVAAAASVASAGVIRRQSQTEVAVYWGQDDSERSVGDYCASGQDIDILVLSFLSSFGNGAGPSGTIGDCTINSDQSSSGCDSLASDIDTCKSNGIKIFLSLAGADSDWKLTSDADAQGVAYTLWNSYANPDATDAGQTRPFGNTFVNGWDLDIESNERGNQYLDNLVSTLRGYFSRDTSGATYYISGAPECFIPEKNMNGVMKYSQFDYLFIQFYNNNCAAADLVKDSSENPNGSGSYNFGDWPGYLSGGASASAKLLVGLPGSKNAATEFDYVPTGDLPTVVSKSTGVAGFGGIMIWEASSSDQVNVNNCNYAQQAKTVLNTGKPC